MTTWLDELPKRMLCVADADETFKRFELEANAYVMDRASLELQRYIPPRHLIEAGHVNLVFDGQIEELGKYLGRDCSHVIPMRAALNVLRHCQEILSRLLQEKDVPLDALIFRRGRVDEIESLVREQTPERQREYEERIRADERDKMGRLISDDAKASREAVVRAWNEAVEACVGVVVKELVSISDEEEAAERLRKIKREEP